jgi:ubiquinol-cytochrome c reductase cytochrome b subunit
LNGIVKWFDERTGWAKGIQEYMVHPVPRLVSPLDFLGVAALFLFINQAVTGIFLAMFYVPSAASYAPHPSLSMAYESILFIMYKVPLGWVVRDLHFWGANLMVIVVVTHMLRVFYEGAYKKPRELTWWAGVGLLLMTLALAFTGYLLPWDQQSFWATAVGTAMFKYAPFLGHFLMTMFQGGEFTNSLTLTRFYSLHMLVLPAALVLLFAVHFIMVLKQGMSFIEEGEGAPKQKTVPFFPYTAFQMNIVVLATAAVLLVIATNYLAPLVAPADPLNKAMYVPIPLWYFFWVYQFLKWVPYYLDPVGVIVIPAIGVLALLALPLIDRGPHREASRRKPIIAAGAVAVAALAALTYLGFLTVPTPLPSTLEAQAHPTFSGTIEPILTGNCVMCHGPTGGDMAGQDFTTYAGVMKGGTTPVKGPVVIPGHPSKSLIVLHVEGKVAPRMPLGAGPLHKAWIQDIINWIKEGAKNN